MFGMCQDVSRNRKQSQNKSTQSLSLRIKYLLKGNVFELLMVCRKQYICNCLSPSHVSVLLVAFIYSHKVPKPEISLTILIVVESVLSLLLGKYVKLCF